jgi:hypothetical protein
VGGQVLAEVHGRRQRSAAAREVSPDESTRGHRGCLLARVPACRASRYLLQYPLPNPTRATGDPALEAGRGTTRGTTWGWVACLAHPVACLARAGCLSPPSTHALLLLLRLPPLLFSHLPPLPFLFLSVFASSRLRASPPDLSLLSRRTLGRLRIAFANVRPPEAKGDKGRLSEQADSPGINTFCLISVPTWTGRPSSPLSVRRESKNCQRVLDTELDRRCTSIPGHGNARRYRKIRGVRVPELSLFATQRPGASPAHFIRLSYLAPRDRRTQHDFLARERRVREHQKRVARQQPSWTSTLPPRLLALTATALAAATAA